MIVLMRGVQDPEERDEQVKRAYSVFCLLFFAREQVKKINLEKIKLILEKNKTDFIGPYISQPHSLTLLTETERKQHNSLFIKHMSSQSRHTGMSKFSTHARAKACIKIQHAAREQQGPDCISGTVEKIQRLKRDRSGQHRSQRWESLRYPPCCIKHPQPALQRIPWHFFPQMSEIECNDWKATKQVKVTACNWAKNNSRALISSTIAIKHLNTNYLKQASHTAAANSPSLHFKMPYALNNWQEA